MERSIPKLLGEPRYELLAGKEALPRHAEGEDALKFIWNGRSCMGTPLHAAALNGQVQSAEELLGSGRSRVDERFFYATHFQKRAQEGSGQALHLAASRGHVAVVQLLLGRRADLAASVTRDGRPHYDVLHAAVFAEGRCDNHEMVHHLLTARAPLQPNSDGKWPLHLAFQVGNTQLIPVLRQEMRHRGVLELSTPSDQPLPLVLGIQMGKMTEKQLAMAASHTPLSLRLFIEHEPLCIPEFLKRIRESGSVEAWQLAQHLSGKDLASVIRRCPAAACALLEGITATPACTHGGWHPLPSRVSFAPRGPSEQLRYMVNPSRVVLVHYERDTEWTYDVDRFEAPAWHEDLQNPTRGSPVHDVDVRVCHVPDIICAEFFSALAYADSSDDLGIFKNPVVNGCIEQVWWNGAYRVDVYQVLLGVWGLAILILESSLVGEGSPGPVHGRKLHPSLGHVATDGDQRAEPGAGLRGAVGEQHLLRDIAVSAAFLGAKGVVDVLHEMAQFAGCLRIGRPCDYLNLGNAWDVFRSMVLMALFFETRNGTVRVLVIFICWMRLLEVFTSAEKIAIALLPIKRLVRSLVPASVMTLIGFCAFTHAFHFLWGYNHDWKQTFLRTFATLITTELPTDPERCSTLELVVTYGAVLFFSIFILNIFIGVIGTQYEQEKDRVPATFVHHRAQGCLNFLVRARILPCALCSRTRATAVASLAVVAALALQVVGITGKPPPYTKSCFVALELVMLMSAYQNPLHDWAPCKDRGRRRYLWLTMPREVPEKEDGHEDVECCVVRGVRPALSPTSSASGWSAAAASPRVCNTDW